MSELVNEKGVPLKAPGLSALMVGLGTDRSDEDWKNRLAAWADQLGEIPSMDRRRIYEVFGKAKQKSTWAYRGGCDCDTECDCPPPRRYRIRVWTRGVRPHLDIRVLRRRALAEHLRRIPTRPFRYAGVELRRPSAVLYMDNV